MRVVYMQRERVIEENLAWEVLNAYIVIDWGG